MDSLKDFRIYTDGWMEGKYSKTGVPDKFVYKGWGSPPPHSVNFFLTSLHLLEGGGVPPIKISLVALKQFSGIYFMIISGENLQFFRSRASTSKFQQLPIDCRLFQNTVNLQDKFFF